MNRTSSPAVDHSIAHQCHLLLGVWRRERPMRFVTFVLLSTLIYALAGPATMSLYSAPMLVSELALLAIAAHSKAVDGHVSRRSYYCFQTLSFATTISYLIPSLFFVMAPEAHLVVLGILLICGTTVYCAGNFGGTMVFYWGYFLAPIIMLPGAILILYLKSGQPFGFIWIAAILGSVLYLTNCILIVKRQEASIFALTKARSDAVETAEELKRVGQIDLMSGLSNRADFDRRLNALLRDTSTDRSNIAIFLLDLDHFKPINDSFGHHVGDQVLTAIGKRLKGAITDNGFAARLGGDEFAFVATDIQSDDHALSRGQDLFDQIAAPINIDGQILQVSGPIGIARADATSDSPSDLCKHADLAMFSIKRDTAQNVALFDPNTVPARPTLQEKSDIETALSNGKIRPLYQPKVALQTGEIIGFEALSRWVHDTGEPYMPDQFLPKIEALSLYRQFTYCMARTTIINILNWLKLGLNPGRISVNLDEETLVSKDAVDDLITLLRSNPNVAQHLTLEVTEDVVLARSGDLIQQSIERFVELGVRISLDDFGLGYASFQHLRQLTLHEMKIDKSFVMSLGEDPASKVIIEGFLSIASGLGIEVVAEGVETELQRKALISSGCHIGQGFYYAPALEQDDAMALLKTAPFATQTNLVRLPKA